MLRPLSGKLLEKAKAELNEDPEKTEQDLEHIEEWLKKQPHLRVKKNRQYLLNFLRSSKFSLQRAKEKIDYFYTVKSIAPEINNKNPQDPKIKSIIKEGVLVPFTKTVAEKPFPVVFLFNWEKANSGIMHFSDIIKAALMYFDVLLQENDNFSVCGCYLLFEMKKFPLSYMKHLTPAVCQRTATLFQNAYPYRLKGGIFINTPKAYEVLINAFMPFLSKKIKERIKIFNENELYKLYDVIPKDFLPKDYGGETESVEKLNAKWNQILLEHTDWFLEENQCGADESKRIGPSPVKTEMFGIDGSFRNLNVD